MSTYNKECLKNIEKFWQDRAKFPLLLRYFDTVIANDNLINYYKVVPLGFFCGLWKLGTRLAVFWVKIRIGIASSNGLDLQDPNRGMPRRKPNAFSLRLPTLGSHLPLFNFFLYSSLAIDWEVESLDFYFSYIFKSDCVQLGLMFLPVWGALVAGIAWAY